MKKKDIYIGISLIAIVAIGGGIGLFFILNPAQQPEEGYKGLPADWSTAPNDAYFMLNNQTNTIRVTLEDILEGIELAIEEDEDTSGSRINEYKDVIFCYQFYYNGFLVTGVDLLDVLEKFDTFYANNMNLTAKGQTEQEQVSSQNIVQKMYKGPEDPLVIAIAAEGKWLADSPLGATYGNFSIIGKNWNVQCLNLENITVIDSWTVSVKVDGIEEFKITPLNMTTNEFTANYSYFRFDDWNYNRQYWGRNISEIISHTSASGKNYTVRVYAIDGVAGPSEENDPYDQIDVEQGIVPPYIADDRINKTMEDLTGVPLPNTDLLMCLIYKQREWGETGFGVTDPVWPYPRRLGYDSGPFSLVVPGRPRGQYVKYLYLINITTTSP
jgi:hypothetical protein